MRFVRNILPGRALAKVITAPPRLQLNVREGAAPVEENEGNFMFGKFLSSAVKLVNSPIDAAEKLVGRLNGEDDMVKEDKIASAPLRALADALREVDDDTEE